MTANVDTDDTCVCLQTLHFHMSKKAPSLPGLLTPLFVNWNSRLICIPQSNCELFLIYHSLLSLVVQARRAIICMFSVLSSFAIILTRNRELIALL